jgi:hypothetical protein
MREQADRPSTERGRRQHLDPRYEGSTLRGEINGKGHEPERQRRVDKGGSLHDYSPPVRR